MANPTTASTNDADFQNAIGQRMMAQFNKDAKAEAYWDAEIKRLRDVKGGELAQDMSRGRK